MSLSNSATSLMRLLLGALSISCLLGCPPQFSDDSCATDSDCFPDEFCSDSSVCEARPIQVAPSVDSFSSDVSSVLAGGQVTLSWSMRNAKSAVLSAPGVQDIAVPEGQLATGSLEVTIDAPITYTLTATNGDLTDVKVVTLEVQTIPAPTITSFTVNPTMVEIDAMVTFSWTVEGAESAKIRSGDEDIHTLSEGELSQGQFMVAVNRSRTYTLEAVNAGGVATEDVQVTVMGLAPVINDLTATPASLVGSGTSTLTWSVDGASSLTLVDNTAAEVDLTGKDLSQDSVDVTLDQTRTYILTAQNQFGTVTDSVQVVVDPTLTVLDFSASPAAIAEGAMTTLSWEITGNVSSLNIDDGSGNLLDLSGVANLARGSVMVSPTADTTYTLDARGGAQMDTATTQVTLLPPLPTIIDFSVDQAEVAVNGSATVSWSVNAEGTLALTLADDQGQSYDISALTDNDSFTIPSISQTSVFTLTATNEAGAVMDTVMVTAGALVTATLTSDVTTATQADFVTLSWTTQNATAISLMDGDGMMYDLSGKSVASDSIMLSPSRVPSTQYTLTVEGFGGPITRDVTITVTPLPRVTLNASAQTVNEGDSVTLSWTSENATSVTIEADDGTTRALDLSGSMVAADSIMDIPTDDTLYTITADDGMGNTVSSSVMVTVQTPGVIVSFTGTPLTITSGGMATLSWQTTGMSSISIVDFNTGTVIDLTGKNINNDSVTVSPTMTADYRLFGVANEGAPPPAQSVIITVN